MGQFSYASSKAASTHLSRMLATTFKDVKVRVNVIAPGVFPRFVEAPTPHRLMAIADRIHSEMTAGESGEDNKSELDMRSYNPAGRYEIKLTTFVASMLTLYSKGMDTDMAA